MKLSSQVILASLVATAAGAQAPVKARLLGPVTSISKETVGNVTGVRQLPNGSILVNDIGRRRLVLLDSTLQGSVVIADTAAGAANMYGLQPTALMPYVGDSSLFLDLAAQSFLVIDPNGKFAHVMAVPRSNDMYMLIQGNPGFDAKGRMVYRANFPRQMLRTADGGIQPSPQPDSQPLIRVNLETRKVDTIATVRVPRMTMVSQTSTTGMTMMRGVQAPLPVVDEWAVLENGSVGLLRGQDYHVDWVMPDGSKSSSPKMEFDWRRLTDDDKIALVDSITNARSQAPSGSGPMGPAVAMVFGGDGGGGGGGNVMVTRMAGGGGDAGGGRGNIAFSGPVPPAAGAAAPAAAATTASTSSGTGASTAPASGSAATSTASAPPSGPANAANAAAANAAHPPAAASQSSATASSASSAAPSASTGPKGGDLGLGTPQNAGQADKMAAVASMMGSMPPIPPPAAAELPDYMPPFRVGAVRPDRDSNIWVQTSITPSAAGNVIYDVINSKGELADRIEIPKGYTLVGFGRGGVIFLTHRENAALKVVRTMR